LHLYSMKLFKYSLVVLLFPCLTWGSSHVVNQAYFLNQTPDKTWNKKDPIFVVGADKIEIGDIAKARKNYHRSTPIYWMLSDDQWNYNNLNLNKDQKVLDFAAQLEEIYIQVLPEHLCPKPAVIHDKNFDILVIDSNWLLFPHEVELFIKQCSHVDLEKFYTEIEESILNAKLKPLVILSHHTVDSKLIFPDGEDPLSKIANQVQQSVGSIDSISNPGYQKYREKLNKMIKNRPNVMIMSGNTVNFSVNSEDDIHHMALSQKEPNHLFLESNDEGVEIQSEGFSESIMLNFNKNEASFVASCENHTGPMHDFKLSGSFYEYFLGSNYRNLWNQKVAIDCFDLDRFSLTVDGVGGSLRSPDFKLKDVDGNFYTLRPLKKEVRIPKILEDTIAEQVLLDQQSSIFPLGFILAATLSRQVGIPTESPRIVYVDINQKAFAAWRQKKFPSGFYQLNKAPKNILKIPEVREKGILEVITTKEMVDRLENVSGYQMNQEAYLKVRLFDILIGDWDRPKDNWHWMVVQKDLVKSIEPFPIDRESAFYRGDGVVSWWRKRKWINYKLQDYTKKLKRAEPMMVESLSMDHRYTSNLTLKDWTKVVGELQQKLSPSSMEKAIDALPVRIPDKDKQKLIQSFQRRLKELPLIAMQMRGTLRKKVDIIGTPNKDSYYIQSGPGPYVYVTSSKDNQVIYSDKFDSKQTKEIRMYGLDGDDEFKLNWNNYTKTKIRVVPGPGKDVLIAREQKMKPRVSLFDDDVSIDSFYGYSKFDYQSTYNDFYSQVNQHKLNRFSPILFLASSNADSGFVLGGGLKYFNDGFQHSPWESTNEIKANAVINRGAANVMYQGAWFDLFGKSDFEIDAEAGLPRFYGSFFGLGNTPPALNETFEDDYYWMRARTFETESRINIPVLQNISLIPRMQFRYRDYLIDNPSFLTTPADNNLDTILRPGTNANINDPNYYLGAGMSVKYISSDTVSGPVKRRIVRAEVKYMLHQGLSEADGHFQTLGIDAGLTGYFQRTKTQWRINGGYGRNFGQWEFFDAQFLGQGQNLRGFFMNRFAGSSRIYDSVEINQSLLRKKLWGVITDIGLGGLFDSGRVFLPGDTGDGTWHKAVGGQTWITFLNSIAFKAGYAHAIFEEQKGFWTFALTTEL
jgi:hypothetical protein